MKKIVLVFIALFGLLGINNVKAQNGTGSTSDNNVPLTQVTPQITPSTTGAPVVTVSTPTMVPLDAPASAVGSIVPPVPVSPVSPAAPPQNAVAPPASNVQTSVPVPQLPVLPPIPAIPPDASVSVPLDI